MRMAMGQLADYRSPTAERTHLGREGTPEGSGRRAGLPDRGRLRRLPRSAGHNLIIPFLKASGAAPVSTGAALRGRRGRGVDTKPGGGEVPYTGVYPVMRPEAGLLSPNGMNF